jgi:hypothetical protein
MDISKTLCSAIACALNSGVVLHLVHRSLCELKACSIMGQCLVKGLLTLSTLWRKEEVLRSHGSSSSWCQKAFYEFDAASRPYMEAGQICSIPMHAQLQFDGMSFSNIMMTMLLLLHLD